MFEFTNGADPVAAIEVALDLSLEDIDRYFKQFIDVEYGPLLSNLNIWIEDYQASFRALNNEDWDEAVAAAQRAIFTYPDYVEIDSPYIAMARAYNHLDETELEFQALESFWQRGGYSPRPLMSLANKYTQRNNVEQAIAVLSDINYADPFLDELHVKLGDLLLENEQPQLALQEYLVSLALDPIDKAAANFRIANAYNVLEDADQSFEYLMTALDIAPQYQPAQMLLLEMSRAGN